MPRRRLSRRLTVAGAAICGVVALGGCASMSTTVTDKDFNHSTSGGGSRDGDHDGSHDGSHKGTVYMSSRHSQKVVVRNGDHVIHSTNMSRGQHRSYSLAPGTYTIVATSDDGACATTIRVRSSATTRITVGC
jgi:hypothetical protein